MENHTEHPERANASGLGTMPRPPLAVQAVTLTLVPLVCAVGVAGNAMVVLVVLRGRHMVTPTNCYLVSLAAADLLVLLAAGVPTVAEAASARVWVFGHAGCLGITYLQYVGINASTGSITAFTVERYLAICHPLRAQTLCTVARAKRIAASVWLGTSAYCVLWLFLADTRETAYADGVQVQCGYRVSRSLYLPIYFLDFALFYALPLGLATAFYVLIARVLFVGPLPPGDRGRSGSAHQGHPAGHQRFSSRGKRGALNSRKQVGFLVFLASAVLSQQMDGWKLGPFRVKLPNCQSLSCHLRGLILELSLLPFRASVSSSVLWGNDSSRHTAVS